MSIQQHVNQLLGLAGVSVGLAKKVYKEGPAIEQAEVEASKEMVKNRTAQERYQNLLSYHTTNRAQYDKLYGSLPDATTKEEN